MFNVNYKTASIGLIAILIGSEAFGQAVRPRVRETVKSDAAVQANPAVKAGDAAVNGFKTEAVRNRVGQINLTNEKGESCNAEEFSGKLANGTSVSYADALSVVKGGFVTMGTCQADTGALLGYTADARETLLLAAVYVRNQFNGKTAFQIDGKAMDTAWAEGLAQAKNRNGGSATAASQIAVASKIKEECKLRR